MKSTHAPKQFSLTQHASMKVLLSCLICSAFNPAYALPTGEQVTAGNANFVRDGQTLNINQTTQQAIVNWQSFGIAGNETVNLTQPNQGSALFRVVGTDPSQIFGSLNATGRLFLINPNGILFAPGSQVDVGSLVATTMQMTDQDFIAKRYQFNSNSDASVVNQGVIRAEDGGYIVLLGNTVENSGSLIATQGSVVMASAQSALLDMYGDGLVQVKLNSEALNAIVNNTGNIAADGGMVQLATNARTAAINVNGVIRANSLVERNGVIRLEGGANSTVLVSGKLEASGQLVNSKGGNVTVTGERVGFLADAVIDVSGHSGGGTALVGGDYQGKNADIQNANRTYVANGASIIADALDSGDGGKVVVWADETTRYYGNISAQGGLFSGNGGFVEVSGKNYLDFNGLVDTSAYYGTAGTLLLDPTNITISTGVNSIESSGATIFQEATTATSILNTTTLQNALATNNVEVTTASPAASAGTITVANAVTWASGNSLTLTANSSIAINAAITTGTAASSLVLNATGNVTQSGAGIIGGAGSLIKNGTGTATLSLANTYTGTTTINTGTLTMGANNVFADTSTILVNGGILNANTRTDTVAGVRLDSGSITGTTGALTSTTDFDLRSGTVSKILGGAVAVNKTTTGSVTLSGANTYTGTTNVNAGTLIADNNAALGTTAGGTTVASGATLAIQGGRTIADALTITGNGVSGTAGALRNISGNNTYTGAITVGAGGARINSDTNTLTISGAGNITGTEALTVGGAGATTISKVIATGTGSLTKDGAGTLTLGGVNTYTGATNINAGILALNATGTIATSAGVANAGTLSIAAAKTIDSMTGSGATVLGANTLTIGDASNTSSTYSGVISGTGGIIKAGTGTLTLGGTNTYTGATNINAGTLSAANANALGGTATGTTVASGSTLNVNNVTLSAEVLTFNGAGVSGAGALTGTGTAMVNGAVTTASASNIGTTSAASTLTLNGVVTATAGTGNFGIVGAGNVTATNAGNNFNTVNINGANHVSLRDANAITIGSGASNLTGNLTVQAGGNITVANNVTAGGDITLAGANFINTAGATALNASGRWLVYSTAPGSNTFGGLLSGNQAIWNTAYPAAISQTGNRYVFTNNPVLTVTSTDQSKTYGQDGAPTVANAYAVTGFVNAAIFGNVFIQDTAANTVTGSATSVGSSVTANVAIYAIDVSPVTATTGYTLIKNSAGLLTVNPAALTVTAGDQVKTYGQTFNFSGTEFTSTGLQNGETIGSATLTSAGAVDTANVGGSPYAISGGNATGGTFNAGNYTITYVDGAMTVNPAIVNINGSRTYNGTTNFDAASFGTVSGVLGQTLNLIGAGSVASANAGAAQAVSLDSLVLADGIGLASNYTLTGGTYTGTINKANITVSTMDIAKTYDGNLSASGTATVTFGTLFNNASNGGTLDNLSGGTFAYTDKNAGTGNKTITVGAVAVNDGNGGGNYQVTYADNITSTINKADITAVTGITAADKVYDGNTNATLNTATASFTGIVSGETLTVGSATGNFNGKDVVTANTVNITDITLADGADLASNYNLTNNTASDAASITTKNITTVAGITAADKVYDGNTSATLNTAAASFTGIVSGETLTVGSATGNFNSKDVVTANTVNITDITLADGADLASNYNLTNNTASDTASITPRALTITVDAGQTKVFGSTDPVFTYTLGGLGLVGGDTLSGALTRNPGEIVASYAINQGTLVADSNYAVSYVGSQFNILAPATLSPRTEAGLVDTNPAFGNYTQQSLLVLNVEAPAAGNADTNNQNSSQCAPAKESSANDKDFALMLNFGLNLPKGINTSCI